MKAERLDAIYRAKARAELRAADEELPGAATVRWRGNPLADVVLVASAPAASDRAARAALTGEPGEAAAKALTALGIGKERLFAFVSRPASDAEPGPVARRVELTVEAVDPRLVIAVDADAARDLAHAYGLDALEPGRAVPVRGRLIGFVGDLAGSLDDVEKKASVWKAFKAIASAL